MFKDKKVLVTGGHGMIGRELVKLLIDLGAIVTVADISENTNLSNVIYKKVDLMVFIYKFRRSLSTSGSFKRSRCMENFSFAK